MRDAPKAAQEAAQEAARKTARKTARGPRHDLADLVLEGGGVKGIALVGATAALAEAGYRFPRVAGTSAGAIVGSVVAGLEAAGEPLARLEDVARTLDYRRFRDRGFPGRYLGPLAFLGDGLSVLVEDGVFEGRYLHDWVTGVLRDLGVETFGDLRTDDPRDDGEMHHRYGLVVTASDLSRHRMVRLPWDYPVYGLDPDEQPVADAVRASASIPFFFEPVRLAGAAGTSTLVDGGLLSNYPIDIFDRRDRAAPRWPTLGVRLDALGLGEPPGGPRRVEPVRGPLALGVSLVVTAIEAGQADHMFERCNVDRSVSVDTGEVSAIDFDLSEADQERLLADGRAAVQRFLATWDFKRWLRDCRGATRS